VRWVSEGKRRFLLFGDRLPSAIPNPTFNPVVKPGSQPQLLKELEAGGRPNLDIGRALEARPPVARADQRHRASGSSGELRYEPVDVHLVVLMSAQAPTAPSTTSRTRSTESPSRMQMAKVWSPVAARIGTSRSSDVCKRCCGRAEDARGRCVAQVWLPPA
jgi:hypothetical protein